MSAWPPVNPAQTEWALNEMRKQKDAVNQTPIVDAEILRTVLPLVYDVLDALLANPNDKAAITAARKLLPERYPESFAGRARR